MKTAVIYDFNHIEIEEKPIPVIGDDEALVRVGACGICSGDVMPWYIKKKAPIVLGHEPAGVIEKIGRNVKNFKTGDRVFIHHHAPCLVCRLCQKGHYTMCETWRKSNIEPGGISEFIRVPAVNLNNDTLKLPDSVSLLEGTLVEPLACSLKGIRRSNFERGDIVLIIGMGVMGHLNLLLLKEMGASRIICADMVPYRLKKSRENGCDECIDVSKSDIFDEVKKMTSGEMADVVIVGPGNVKAIESGIRCAGKGGTVLLFTPTPPEDVLTINPFQLYFNEINLISSYSCGPDDTKFALSMIEKGVVKENHVITHKFSISNTSEAYRLTAEAKESLKAVIVFDEN